MATIKKRMAPNKEQTPLKSLRNTFRPNLTTGRGYGRTKYRDSSTGYLLVGKEVKAENPYPANQFGSREEYDRIMNEVADKIESGEIPRRAPQAD